MDKNEYEKYRFLQEWTFEKKNFNEKVDYWMEVFDGKKISNFYIGTYQRL